MIDHKKRWEEDGDRRDAELSEWFSTGKLADYLHGGIRDGIDYSITRGRNTDSVKNIRYEQDRVRVFSDFFLRAPRLSKELDISNLIKEALIRLEKEDKYVLLISMSDLTNHFSYYADNLASLIKELESFLREKYLILLDTQDYNIEDYPFDNEFPDSDSIVKYNLECIDRLMEVLYRK